MVQYRNPLTKGARHSPDPAADAADILCGHNEVGRKAIRQTLEQRAVFLKDILMQFPIVCLEQL